MTKDEFEAYKAKHRHKSLRLKRLTYEDILQQKNIAVAHLKSGASMPVAYKNSIGTATKEMRMLLMSFPDFKEQYDNRIEYIKLKAKRTGIYPY